MDRFLKRVICLRSEWIPKPDVVMQTLYETISDLNENQKNTLGLIAMGQDGCHHLKTIQKLLDLGLIVEYEETLGGRFPVRVKRYLTPIEVHFTWCQWCSDNYKEDE